MTTSAVTAEKATPTKLTCVLPEEQFWRRYSPHGEAPLSLAGSMTVHVLATGGLLLFGIFLASLFFQTKQSLPVEPVRIALGLPGGQGDPVNRGLPGVIEDIPEPRDDPQPGVDEGEPRPALDPVEKKKVQEKFDPKSSRWFNENPTQAVRKFARLEDGIRSKLAEGLKGSPDGQVKESGDKASKNTGPGASKAKLTKREKRMLRWHLRFSATSGPEYLAQLHGLGAILVIPVKEKEGAEPTYQVVRDLRPGKAKLKDEDLTKLQRIYWIDDKESSVKDIIAALGIRLPKTPSKFIAFMPEKLEDELFHMERRYMERVLHQPYKEDRIEETVFRAVPTKVDGKSIIKAELISVKLKP